jgi:rhodanese-related sulfurtransferase
MKTLIFALSTAILSLTSCAQNNIAESPTTEAVAPAEDPTIKRVSKTEFQTFLAENNTVQLIDVRTPQEFDAGNIEGAENIDFNNSAFENNINLLDKNIPVLIYCRSGARSAKALKVFEANGFTTVLELEGGYLNW